MKVIHIKSQASVALPIYTSDLSHLDVLGKSEKHARTPKKEVRTISFLNDATSVQDSLKRCVK